MSVSKRSRGRRSGRHAVLWGVAVVILAHLGLAAAMETVLPQLRDPEYGYRLVRVREVCRTHPDRPLVLALGTSRTANGIAPTAAGFANGPGAPLLFNFGLSGAGPVHLRSHFARLRADGVKPAAVLVELFPATLAVDGPHDALYASAAAKLTVGDLRRLNPDLADPLAFHRRWVVERLNPWHTQRLVLVSHAAPGLLPVMQRLNHYWSHTDRFGFDAYPTNKADELRESRLAGTRSAYAVTARTLRVSDPADRALRGLVADCRAAGVPVAFYLMPESPAFRGWYSTEARVALLAYTRALSAELGCPVFDAPGNYTEEDFGDGHHLLPAAAARFTRNLTDRHLKPWLAEVLK